jgi:hypothetical protein
LASGGVGAVSTVPAPPPEPEPSVEIFADPVVVAQAWMTQWCAADDRAPTNDNVERAAVFATDRATTLDRAAGDDPAARREVVERELSERCDRITAETSPEVPREPDRVFVTVTAHRTHLAAGVPFQVETVAQTRVVLRRDDGRWLVDTRVDAG